MLLQIKDLARNPRRDMIVDVIAQNEGDGLPFRDEDSRNNTFTQHARPLFSPEDNSRTRLHIILSLVDRNIQLQLILLAVKSHRLAELTAGLMDGLLNGGDMLLPGVVECWEDLNI